MWRSNHINTFSSSSMSSDSLTDKARKVLFKKWVNYNVWISSMKIISDDVLINEMEKRTSGNFFLNSSFPIFLPYLRHVSCSSVSWPLSRLKLCASSLISRVARDIPRICFESCGIFYWTFVILVRSWSCDSWDAVSAVGSWTILWRTHHHCQSARDNP